MYKYITWTSEVWWSLLPVRTWSDVAIWHNSLRTNCRISIGLVHLLTFWNTKYENKKEKKRKEEGREPACSLIRPGVARRSAFHRSYFNQELQRHAGIVSLCRSTWNNNNSNSKKEAREKKKKKKKKSEQSNEFLPSTPLPPPSS